MRVPLSWLKEYVDITLPVEELAERLTLAGLEVAKIDYVGVPSGDPNAAHLVWDREKIRVGAIVEVRRHPNADRLTIAMVDYGGDELEPCVNGAPNLQPFADKGPIDPPLKAIIAFEGAELYDGHADDGARMVLKARKLRGIENRSMVCSEKELGLSDNHEGILLLDLDAPTGAPAQDVLGDIVLDIELTPNLARCWGVLGVAREVAALTGQKVRYPSYDFVAAGRPIEGQVSLRIEEPDLNPRFTLTLIRGVTVQPSPVWMQRRLLLCGMRPINNIVDVTNYVMLETGQPIHAFDYDLLAARAGGDPPTIITRTARPGETLTTLDGVHRELDPFTELVCDTAGALSIAGVIGGAETEIQPDTRNVLVEVANWNFINLRQTLSAQRERGKEISSEAGARFSRGVHPALALTTNTRAVEMMRQLGGGQIAQGVIDEYPKPAPMVEVELPLAVVERLSGIPFSAQAVVDALTRLEFVCTISEAGDIVRAVVPPHRLDISADDPVTAQADLVEEITRIYGYDRVPETLVEDALPPQRANTALEREERVRDALVNAGLREVIAYRLTTPEREALLTPPGAASAWPDAPYVRLKNPTSQERVAMRHTLLAGLLDIAAANLRFRDRVAIFEVGEVFLPAGAPLPEEPTHLGIVMTGARSLPTWSGGRASGQEAAAPMDFFDLKGVIEAMAAALYLPDVTYTPAQHSTFHPGRVAALNVAGEPAGVFGEVHPLVCRAYGLPDGAVALAAEFDLGALQRHMPDATRVAAIPRFQAVYQDIAVIVDAGLAAAEVHAEIMRAGQPVLRQARLFDVYTGSPIPAGKKSLAYALTFQSDTETLTDKAVAKLQGKIVKALQQKFGATLRA